MATYTITLTAIIKGKKYDTEWTNLSINKFNKRCELYSFRAPIFILKFQQMQQHHPYLLYCQKLYSNVTAKNLATCTHARTSFSSACGYHTLPHQRSRPHHEPIYHLCLDVLSLNPSSFSPTHLWIDQKSDLRIWFVWIFQIVFWTAPIQPLSTNLFCTDFAWVLHNLLLWYHCTTPFNIITQIY